MLSTYLTLFVICLVAFIYLFAYLKLENVDWIKKERGKQEAGNRKFVGLV